MLSPQDNELMCRVGPGTPMGDVLRHYWLPVSEFGQILVKEPGPGQRYRDLGRAFETALLTLEATSEKSTGHVFSTEDESIEYVRKSVTEELYVLPLGFYVHRPRRHPFGFTLGLC